MIVVISLTVLVTAVVTMTLTAVWMDRPSLPRRVRRQLALGHEMAALLRAIVHPTSLDRVDVLSAESRKAAEELLSRYQKETE